MAHENVPCPICAASLERPPIFKIAEGSFDNDDHPRPPAEHEYECSRCGTFRLTDAMARTPPDFGKLKPFLSAATRQHWERDQEPVVLTERNWRELAEERRLQNPPSLGKHGPSPAR